MRMLQPLTKSESNFHKLLDVETNDSYGEPLSVPRTSC